MAITRNKQDNLELPQKCQVCPYVERSKLDDILNRQKTKSDCQGLVDILIRATCEYDNEERAWVSQKTYKKVCPEEVEPRTIEGSKEDEIAFERYTHQLGNIGIKYEISRAILLKQKATEKD